MKDRRIAKGKGEGRVKAGRRLKGDGVEREGRSKGSKEGKEERKEGRRLKGDGGE